ncbi:hypothetical protein DFH07DRAFT_835349 [Mycena maculata]|uniref:Uncharacterized protein n=1 Tax=Mycena maculata TaxID=230809 RepID=A0AAD7IIN3_9AGAR|nr:hypothetical protein DFH07DRAFT_835349 [Mycena maculata]
MVHKVFSAFEDDTEFQLIMFAPGPFYAEHYDTNAALAQNRHVIYRAETHYALYSEAQKNFDYRDALGRITAKTLIIVGGGLDMPAQCWPVQAHGRPHPKCAAGDRAGGEPFRAGAAERGVRQGLARVAGGVVPSQIPCA